MYLRSAPAHRPRRVLFVRRRPLERLHPARSSLCQQHEHGSLCNSIGGARDPDVNSRSTTARPLCTCPARSSCSSSARARRNCASARCIVRGPHHTVTHTVPQELLYV